ncbi:unnamed protein product [Rotaria sordida]|nr:unnamed protein product [Rotaria sordida]
MYQNENEILMYPARQFQVVSSFNSGNQLKIIHIKEIQPPFPLIHIPSTSSTIINPIENIQPSFLRIQISSSSFTNNYQNKKLQDLIEQCQSQSEVNLMALNLNDEDMKIVVKEAIINKQCKELYLQYNKLTSVGASIIANALNNNATLEDLYLTDNRLCDKGVRNLITILSLNSSTLSLLDLQDTSITDEGATYVAEMLKTNTRLCRLLLGDNEISDRGVEQLSEALSYHNNTLISLNLTNNKLISELGIDSLVKMLKHNQTLIYLYIEECDLSEKEKDKLRQTARIKKGFKLEM